MMRRKGKLVAKRNVKSMTSSQLAARSKKRVIGVSEYTRVRKQFETLVANRSRKGETLIDGMIMGLVQQNLTNREIREVFNVGNNRIDRVRRVTANPGLLKAERPKPKHAATPDDIHHLKAHLATYDTEDGYPCAHRRPMKFFLKQGLT